MPCKLHCLLRLILVFLVLERAAGQRPLLLLAKDGSRYKEIVERLHSPSVHSVDDLNTMEIVDNGTPVFSLIVLASQHLPCKPSKLINYLRAGGNLFWAFEGALNGNAKDLLKEFGLQVAGDFTDPFTENETGNCKLTESHYLSTKLKNVKLSFEGIGMRILTSPFTETPANHLVTPLLTGLETGQTGEIRGQQIVLAATIDGFNGARVFILGSMKLLEDPAKDDNHRAFVDNAFAWSQGQLGVVEIASFDHFQGDDKNADAYVVKTSFDITLCLRETGHGHTKPFLPEDAQLEIVMQHPRERVTLIPDSKDNCLHGKMMVPDIYGKYTLTFEYIRPGLSILSTKRMITVRPQWLDQLPRFVVAALPYYAGWQSQLLVTCLFLLPVLYGLRRKGK